MMFALFFTFIAAETHIHIPKMLNGTWIVDRSIITSQESEPIIDTFNITFITQQNLLELTAFSEEADFTANLVFQNRYLFSMINPETNEKIAEFEFFHPLFPHITATGIWKNNSIYVAELISFTSMSLSIFDKETKTTTVLTFSKDVFRGPKSFLEANFTLIASIGLIMFHFLRSEYKKREAALKIKKQNEEDMKKFEEEIAKEEEEEENEKSDEK